MDGITDRAGQELMKALDDANARNDQCIRIELKSTGRGSMKLDAERPGDKTFKFEDRTVVVLDKQEAQLTEGHQLDFVDGKFCLV
jgi:Fe-S cluster assembly iron-binding protein IscA